jgi:hypothetical protein
MDGRLARAWPRADRSLAPMRRPGQIMVTGTPGSMRADVNDDVPGRG